MTTPPAAQIAEIGMPDLQITLTNDLASDIAADCAEIVRKQFTVKDVDVLHAAYGAFQEVIDKAIAPVQAMLKAETERADRERKDKLTAENYVCILIDEKNAIEAEKEMATAEAAVLLEALWFADRALVRAKGQNYYEGGLTTPRTKTVGDVIKDARNTAPLAAAHLAEHRRLVERADKAENALALMLDDFGGYVCPAVDAGITAMQDAGKDRWSMDAQIRAVVKP